MSTSDLSRDERVEAVYKLLKFSHELTGMTKDELKDAASKLVAMSDVPGYLKINLVGTGK